MPPKAKVSREEIVRAAVALVREKGEGALNARDLAAALSCSTQPIFFNFSNMAEVRQAVLDYANELYLAYREEDMHSGEFPPYKASGMSYIRFATEEKELFKMLFMRDRAGDTTSVDDEDDLKPIYAIIQEQIGIPCEEARLFHLENWAVVHGIAAMTVTGYLSLEKELVSRMLTDSYLGLKAHYERRREDECH